MQIFFHSCHLYVFISCQMIVFLLCKIIQNQFCRTTDLLGISTVLNAIYFMKTVIRIFVPERRTDCEVITIGAEKTYTVTIVLFICLNIALGMLSQPIVKWLQSGLAMFG